VSYGVKKVGSQLQINGSLVSVGGSITINRYTLASPRNFGYPTQIFRAANNPPTFTPDDSSGGFTISGLTSDMAAWNGSYLKTSAGNYYKTSGSNYRVALVSGTWRLAYFGFGANMVFSGNTFTYSGSTYGAPTSGSGTITYSGSPQPGTAMPDGAVSWRVEVVSTQGNSDLLAATSYLSIPEVGSLLTKNLPWGATALKDIITVLAIPGTAVDAAITTTVRSACVSPPP
jgi:hypothetical protein